MKPPYMMTINTIISFNIEKINSLMINVIQRYHYQSSHLLDKMPLFFNNEIIQASFSP